MDEPWSRASVAKRKSKVILIAPDRAQQTTRPALRLANTPHRRHRCIGYRLSCQPPRRDKRIATRRGGAPPGPPRAHGTTAESRINARKRTAEAIDSNDGSRL